MSTQWSKYQQAVFTWHDSAFSDGKGKAVSVRSGAGSGKTTTLVEAGKSHIHFDHFECDVCHTPLHEIRTNEMEKRWSYCPFCGYSLYKTYSISDEKRNENE